MPAFLNPLSQGQDSFSYNQDGAPITALPFGKSLRESEGDMFFEHGAHDPPLQRDMRGLHSPKSRLPRRTNQGTDTSVPWRRQLRMGGLLSRAGLLSEPELK